MELKLPEDRLFELGFEVLDYIYGELTIKMGRHLDEVFIDMDGYSRLGYTYRVYDNRTVLSYLPKDRDFFFSIIPVEEIDYERVLTNWVKNRHNRKAYRTVPTLEWVIKPAY